MHEGCRFRCLPPLHGEGEGVAEWPTTQHVNEKLDTVSAWLTGSFTLLLNQPWSYCAVCWSHRE